MHLAVLLGRQMLQYINWVSTHQGFQHRSCYYEGLPVTGSMLFQSGYRAISVSKLSLSTDPFPSPQNPKLMNLKCCKNECWCCLSLHWVPFGEKGDGLLSWVDGEERGTEGRAWFSRHGETGWTKRWEKHLPELLEVCRAQGAGQPHPHGGDVVITGWIWGVLFIHVWPTLLWKFYESLKYLKVRVRVAKG